jgi:hypothetical protein
METFLMLPSQMEIVLGATEEEQNAISYQAFWNSPN